MFCTGFDLFSVVAHGADATGAADSTTAVRAAMAAAGANVTATGRRSIVYFPAGKYSFLAKAAREHIDVNGRTKLTFLGTPGGRSKLFLNGSAGGGDWYLFAVRGNSTDIEFRDLHMEMTGLTNPDSKKQNHCIKIGDTGGTDVRVYDCTFGFTIGDCIRLVGEPATPITKVQVHRCRFVGFGRQVVLRRRSCVL
jgi:hypothetical protein